jgi:hypothetical protein
MTTPQITDTDLIAVVRQAMDSERERLGVTTYEALADHYALSNKTLLFLRSGRWTRTDRLIITALVNALQPAEPCS